MSSKSSSAFSLMHLLSCTWWPFSENVEALHTAFAQIKSCRKDPCVTIDKERPFSDSTLSMETRPVLPEEARCKRFSVT